MTPDEQAESDRIAAAEWREYNAARARTGARLRALGLPGDDLNELAAAAATVLEQLRERGILLP